MPGLLFMCGSCSSELTHGEGGMKDEHARFYLANVVAALQYLHDVRVDSVNRAALTVVPPPVFHPTQRGLAYRDLKPENLLVGANGYLKMCDFGFVKSIPYEHKGEVQSKSYTMLGSPDYLAPEVRVCGVLSAGSLQTCA